MQIFPIIGYIDQKTAHQQLFAARQNGASGVFLVSHYGQDAEMVGFAAETKCIDPHFPIGIHLVCRTPLETFEQARHAAVDMVWCSDTGVSSAGLAPEAVELSARAKEMPLLRVYVSVALSPLSLEEDPGMAAKIALKAGFTPITSALATRGYPHDDKIGAMYGATAGRMAVAGGWPSEGVFDYAPYFHHVLMASGHTLGEKVVDSKKLQQLILGAAWPDAFAFA